MVEEEINLARYLQMVEKRKFLVLLVLALAVIATIVATQLAPQNYKTVTVIQLSNPGISLGDEAAEVADQNLLIKRSSSYFVEASTADGVLKETISQTKVGLSVAELRGKVQPSLAEAGNMLTLLITDSQPKRAALIANKLAENLVQLAKKLDADKREIFQKNLDGLKVRLAKIEEQKKIGEETISQAKTDTTISSGDRILAQAQALQALSALDALRAELLQERRDIEAKLFEMGESKVIKLADVPHKPSGRSLGLNLGLALVLGLAAGVGLAILAESWMK